MHLFTEVNRKILHITRYLFLWVMALQILNLSIDSIDFQPMESTNLSEFNDLNTITEYFAEVVLGYTNMFPESSQKQQKQAQLQKHLDIKLFNTVSCYTADKDIPASFSFEFPIDERYRYLFFKEINPPPPKYPGNFI